MLFFFLACGITFIAFFKSKQLVVEVSESLSQLLNKEKNVNDGVEILAFHSLGSGDNSAESVHDHLHLEEKVRTPVADGCIRIVCSTTALGMGFSAQNVLSVAAFGCYDAVDLVQMLGRVARESESQGVFVFVSLPDGRDKETTSSSFFHDFESTAGCRNTVIAKYFDGVALPEGKRSCLMAKCDRCFQHQQQHHHQQQQHQQQQQQQQQQLPKVCLNFFIFYFYFFFFLLL